MPEAVRIGRASIGGHLGVPAAAAGVVVCGQGSGGSRHGPSNRLVVGTACARGPATRLRDRPTEAQASDRRRVSGIPLFVKQRAAANDRRQSKQRVRGRDLSRFSTGTGAMAAQRPHVVRAVISRGGRPDLADPRRPRVRAQSRPGVASANGVARNLNRDAMAHLASACRLDVLPAATHLFEPPGALQAMTRRVADGFEHGRAARAKRVAQRAEVK